MVPAHINDGLSLGAGMEKQCCVLDRKLPSIWLEINPGSGTVRGSDGTLRVCSVLLSAKNWPRIDQVSYLLSPSTVLLRHVLVMGSWLRSPRRYRHRLLRRGMGWDRLSMDNIQCSDHHTWARARTRGAGGASRRLGWIRGFRRWGINR